MMNNVQVFFNKPQRPIDISQLLTDITDAKRKVCIASAWFTDTQIADAIIASKAPEKAVIINQGDVKRGTTAAYKKIHSYFDIKTKGQRYIFPWENKEAFPDDEERYRLDSSWCGLSELGSGDWNEGVMHHKFVIIDDDIVWTGSYNLTFHARNNYENLIRIESQEVTQAYWQEVVALSDEDRLWWGTTQSAFADGCFRCCVCERLYPDSELGEDGSTWFLCVSCKNTK